jgi:hypothetical protein
MELFGHHLSRFVVCHGTLCDLRQVLVIYFQVSSQHKRINVTAGYLLGETENDILFKDPDMLKRFQEINALNEEDKKCLLANVDAFLRDARTRQAYSK